MERSVTEARDTDRFVEDLTDQTDDFGRWYTEVVRKAQLADYAPVRGCMAIRPYGYALWEHMQRLLDMRIKATGHQNMYFPLLFPYKLLEKEAEHVEGFAPQVAWVTHGGTEKLDERLVVRPTSETIIGTMYAKWVQSWRDLPILINQWANVVRWEKVTRLFLRTTEFLWQEGHTAHETAEEAQEETLRMLGVYKEFVEEELAIPVVDGPKTDSEKFAGAVQTYSIEALMGDGRALQAGTSHNLGQNFAKAFNTTFQGRDGKQHHVWQTSWGVSTRLVGALVMTHSDDDGLVLPPRLAPIHVAIVPIYRKEDERTAVLEAAQRIAAALRDDGLGVEIDDREGLSPGAKYYDWERKGVPLRLEIGPRDLAQRQVVVARRGAGKAPLQLDAGLAAAVRGALDEIQAALLAAATQRREASSIRGVTKARFLEFMQEPGGFAYGGFCGRGECEAEIKAETGVLTVRRFNNVAMSIEWPKRAKPAVHTDYEWDKIETEFKKAFNDIDVSKIASKKISQILPEADYKALVTANTTHTDPS